MFRNNRRGQAAMEQPFAKTPGEMQSRSTSLCSVYRTKKSQAAMEFLITYGWALMVVLIVLLAFSYFALTNPFRFLPEKCEIVTGISCYDFNAVSNDPVSSDGTNDPISIILANGLGKNIDGITLNITECMNYEAEVHITGIPAGEKKKVVIQCKGMIVESRFRSDIKVQYNTTTAGNILRHSGKGYISVEIDQT